MGNFKTHSFKMIDGQLIKNMIQFCDLPRCSQDLIKRYIPDVPEKLEKIFFKNNDKERFVLIHDENNEGDWFLFSWIGPDIKKNKFPWEFVCGEIIQVP